VRLPKSVFAPYTTIATNVLFLTKGEPTKEIWYYEHPLPDGVKAYNKTKPMRVSEFDVEKAWWNDRKETEQAWKVSAETIVERNYNLDIKNPNMPDFVHADPNELLRQYADAVAKVKDLQDQLKASLEQSLGK
jgi:type I restriction enzyme M protein